MRQRRGGTPLTSLLSGACRQPKLNIDEWRKGWVGYAHKRHFYDSNINGALEGFAVGTSTGTVRFKVYDKIAETKISKSGRFWRSVWGIEENVTPDVARFEWSIRAYSGKFKGVRYLSDLSLESFMDLLNYVSLKWGRLCIPERDDKNKARWKLSPLWLEIRRMIEDWSFGYQGQAKRTYDYRPELSEGYLQSISGWIAGLMARLGIENNEDNPASIADALELLHAHGYSLPQKAQEKWELWSRLLQKENE